jgi:mRNA-degrading endonuclease YafQ of YafQ-DinJ toxin-antitoxin module
MRTIEWTNAFKRDYKKALTNPRHRDLPLLLEQAATELANDRIFAAKYRDHPNPATIPSIASVI